MALPPGGATALAKRDIIQVILRGPSKSVGAVKLLASEIRDRLGERTIVFVGLMGAGKTAIGRQVAQILDLPFADSDHEIEAVSKMTVPELFERYGEPEFRALEQRVIERLMKDGPRIVSTGGGAFMSAQTRRVIGDHGLAVWLKADLDLLMERVSKRQNRPLLKDPDPRGVMLRLMEERYPIYAHAHLTFETRDAKREIITEETLQAIARHLGVDTGEQQAGSQE